MTSRPDKGGARPAAGEKMRELLESARNALAAGVERAKRFADAEEFHRSLLRSLDKHPDFRDAVRSFHTHAVSDGVPGKGQVARRVVPAGRVQAPRHDLPKGRSRP